MTVFERAFRVALASTRWKWRVSQFPLRPSSYGPALERFEAHAASLASAGDLPRSRWGSPTLLRKPLTPSVRQGIAGVFLLGGRFAGVHDCANDAELPGRNRVKYRHPPPQVPAARRGFSATIARYQGAFCLHATRSGRSPLTPFALDIEGRSNDFEATEHRFHEPRACALHVREHKRETRYRA